MGNKLKSVILTIVALAGIGLIYVCIVIIQSILFAIGCAIVSYILWACIKVALDEKMAMDSLAQKYEDVSPETLNQMIDTAKKMQKRIKDHSP